MKISDFPEAFAALAQRATEIAECIKITREDGVIYRFTAYSEDLVLTEADAMQYTYKRANSFDITALEMSDGLAVTNMDLNCIIDDDDITEGDLLKGFFDHAKVELFVAVWDSSGVVWTLPLRVSWVGEIQSKGVQFKGDIRGITQRLNQVFTKTTSLECRYIFGDSDCTVDLVPYTISTTVAAVNSSFTTVTATADLSGRNFRYGRVILTNGQSEGLDMEILDHVGQVLTLFLPSPSIIEVGDTIDLIEGCAKNTTACTAFSNLLNYGGEPYLEGKDVFGRYPDAQDIGFF